MLLCLTKILLSLTRIGSFSSNSVLCRILLLQIICGQFWAMLSDAGGI